MRSFNYDIIMVTSTGGGLKIGISAQHLLHNDWLSFCSWYSISKNLPDANVCVVTGSEPPIFDIFQWARRLNVKIQSRNKSLDLLIDCYTLAVREWSSNEIVDVKSDESATFINYKSGWGLFDPIKWENRKENPFNLTDMFKSENMSINEWKLVDLWHICEAPYTVIG